MVFIFVFSHILSTMLYILCTCHMSSVVTCDCSVCMLQCCWRWY